MKVSFKKALGSEIKDWIEPLSHLRIEVFREFPYLYDGNLDYEQEYLATYSKASSSCIFLAFVDEELVGASTCVGMSEENEDFKKPFLENEYDLNRIFYFGESLIKKEYRGNKIGHEFFKMREEHAAQILPDLKYTCFCAVKRSYNHPLKPSNYKPLDLFWNRMGYSKNENLVASFEWKDIDKDEEDLKKMVFWLKKVEP